MPPISQFRAAELKRQRLCDAAQRLDEEAVDLEKRVRGLRREAAKLRAQAFYVSAENVDG
jgi:hypothetical protein